MLLTKPENPLFFLHRVLPELAPDSPESRLDGVYPPSELVGVSCSRWPSPAEKLADCRNDGVNIR